MPDQAVHFETKIWVSSFTISTKVSTTHFPIKKKFLVSKFVYFLFSFATSLKRHDWLWNSPYREPSLTQNYKESNANEPNLRRSQGSPTFWNWQVRLGYRLMRRATSLMQTSEIRDLLNSPLIMLLLIIDDIHLCEDNDHVDAIFKTGPTRATHVVLAGDLVPGGTMFGGTTLSDLISIYTM